VAADGSSAVARLRERVAASPERRVEILVTLSSLALIAAKVGTMGLGFIAWIVAARVYPASSVGLASGAVAAVTLCTQVALIGVGSAVITLLPHRIGRPAPFLDTSVSLLTISAVATGLVFLLFAGGVLRELRVVAAEPSYALLFLALTVAGTLGVLFDQVSTARRRGDQVLIRGVAAGGTTVVVVVAIAALLSGSGSKDIFVAWVIGGLVTASLGLVTVGRAVPGYSWRPRFSPPLARELVGVGFPNYLLTLTERAPGFILPIVVTELLSPSDNAHWYAAWMMAWVAFVIPVQIGMTSFAEIARDPTRTAHIVRRGITTSLAVGVGGAVVLAVLAGPALGLLGAGYAGAGATPLRILLIGVVPMTFIQAYYSYCRARRHLNEAIALGMVTSVASVVLPAAAGLAVGLPGMAVCWLAVQSVAAIVASTRLWVLARRV
jgi:O-antigen/teichoic acid export membrane protein